MIQAFEPGAIRGEGPPAIGRDPINQPLEGHVQPHRGAVPVDRCTVLHVGKRAAAGGHDHVRPAKLLGEDGALDRPEIRFAAARKDVCNRRVLTLFDELVDVRRLPAKASGKRLGHRCLAGGHEPDKIKLLGFHETISRPRVSKKPGYEILTASAPAIVDGPLAANAAIANAIAIRWSPCAWATPPGGRDPRAPRIEKPSSRSSASMPRARNPATRVAMRSLSFTRNSWAPRTVTSSPAA